MRGTVLRKNTTRSFDLNLRLKYLQRNRREKAFIIIAFILFLMAIVVLALNIDTESYKKADRNVCRTMMRDQAYNSTDLVQNVEARCNSTAILFKNVTFMATSTPWSLPRLPGNGHVSSLVFVDCSLATLPDHAFRNTPKIQILSFINCNFASINNTHSSNAMKTSTALQHLTFLRHFEAKNTFSINSLRDLLGDTAARLESLNFTFMETSDSDLLLNNLNMANMRKLSFKNNKELHLTSKSFASTMPKIEEIYLDSTEKLAIDDGPILEKLKHLKVLSLKNCSLETLSVLLPSSNDVSLYLAGNNWRCDCSMAWLLHQTILDEPRCHDNRTFAEAMATPCLTYNANDIELPSNVPEFTVTVHGNELQISVEKSIINTTYDLIFMRSTKRKSMTKNGDNEDDNDMGCINSISTEYRLKKLKPASNYLICLMPPTTAADVSSVETISVSPLDCQATKTAEEWPDQTWLSQGNKTVAVTGAALVTLIVAVITAMTVWFFVRKKYFENKTMEKRKLIEMEKQTQTAHFISGEKQLLPPPSLPNRNNANNAYLTPLPRQRPKYYELLYSKRRCSESSIDSTAVSYMVPMETHGGGYYETIPDDYASIYGNGDRF